MLDRNKNKLIKMTNKKINHSYEVTVGKFVLRNPTI